MLVAVLLFCCFPMPLAAVAAAENNLLITVKDTNGNPLDNAFVFVAGSNCSHRATNESDGTYLFIKHNPSITSYDLHISCDGYYAEVIHGLSATETELTVILDAEVSTNEWVDFGVYYTTSGALPTYGNLCAPGTDYSHYGPSGDNTALVTVSIDITRLQEYVDAGIIRTATNKRYNWTTNAYEFSCTDADTDEAARIALCETFWEAIKECMSFESEWAFRDTGLFDIYISYSLKKESSWFTSTSYHLDGILNVAPPVWMIEMSDAGVYFGGFATDSKSTDAFPTFEDVLYHYEDHLGQDIEWTPVADTTAAYTGTYIHEHHIHTVTVTQTNYAAATEVENSEINYEPMAKDADTGEYNYYLATFNMELSSVEEEVPFTVTFTDGLAHEIVFDDYVEAAADGAAVRPYPGSTDREGYVFEGWLLQGGDDTLYSNEEIAQMTVNGADLVFVASYSPVLPSFDVVFHSNLSEVSEDVFRTFYSYGSIPPDGCEDMLLTEHNAIPAPFYDIPQLDTASHNQYIFKGWYMDPVKDDQPLNWDALYTEDTHIYAHWIHAGTVAQEDDGKLGIPNGTYNGFDLVGTQIRYAVDDEGYYDYSSGQSGANCGLRFIAVLSEDVWSQLLQVHSANPGSAHYGFVMAKTSTAETYCAGAENYQLWCKDSNANGIDTTTSYKYVKNIICTSNQGGEYTGSAISRDHFNGTGYRLYTAVLTYTSQTTPEALAAAQSVEFLARAYLQYTDANGLSRIYYNNYSEPTNRYNSCSASYQTVFNLTQQALEGNS